MPSNSETIQLQWHLNKQTSEKWSLTYPVFKPVQHSNIRPFSDGTTFDHLSTRPFGEQTTFGH